MSEYKLKSLEDILKEKGDHPDFNNWVFRSSENPTSEDLEEYINTAGGIYNPLK